MDTIENLFNSRVSFNDAIEDATRNKWDKNLLLGNGFSIAWRSRVFDYKSIFDRANFLDISAVKSVFTNLGTEDFEEVIGALENANSVISAYTDFNNIPLDILERDAHRTKEVLIETIKQSHPANRYEIDDEEYTNCINFLSRFLESNGAIFTLNYDLLLYWVLLEGGKKREHFNFSDGCGEVNQHLQWSKSKRDQNIYFLHGALHFFDDGDSIVKIQLQGNGNLMKQIGEKINSGRFPIYVAEGTSKKKMEKINHNSYLYHAFDSFKNRLNTSDCLFTYGVRFSNKDKHIVDAIVNSELKSLYFGIYDEEFSEIDETTVTALRSIGSSGKNIKFYNTNSYNPWKEQ